MTLTSKFIITSSSILILTTLAACDKKVLPIKEPEKMVEKFVAEVPYMPYKSKSDVISATRSINDNAVTDNVKNAISSELELKLLKISVNTQKRVVSLNGSVGSADLSDKVENIAAAVDGVKRVNNQLIITSEKN
ncbi:MAG: hypothetical protein ACI8VC_001702 [Candidatus Endobugula sp.]|jgi:hypothetical protein